LRQHAPALHYLNRIQNQSRLPAGAIQPVWPKKSVVLVLASLDSRKASGHRGLPLRMHRPDARLAFSAYACSGGADYINNLDVVAIKCLLQIHDPDQKAPVAPGKGRDKAAGRGPQGPARMR